MKKRLFILTLICVMAAAVSVFAAIPVRKTATPSTQAVGLAETAMGKYNNVSDPGSVYNIDDSNYMQLRDIAKLIDFDIVWNADDPQSIYVYTDQRYSGDKTPSKAAAQAKTATKVDISLYIDDNRVGTTSINIFNIDGSNYFQLRDVARLVDFGCIYDEESRMIVLNPYRCYGEDNTYARVRTITYGDEETEKEARTIDLSAIPNEVVVGDFISINDILISPAIDNPLKLLTVESSNPNVLYIDINKAYAKTMGTVTLTYKCGNASATKIVTVKPTSDKVYTESYVLGAIQLLNGYYPEGMTWTNDNKYKGNSGCAAFASDVSDRVFGSLPSRAVESFEDLRAGDVIRIGDYHSVVVLENLGDSVKVVEGNYNSSIHWGRVITKSSLESEGYSATTRYPS